MPSDAKVKEQSRVSSIWIIPGIALLIGAWMLGDAILRSDPVVEIRFERASGIEPNRTKVKVRSVEVGIVEDVQLRADGEGVVVKARIGRENAHLLSEDSLFWVVRPRIGIGGVSGVGTLLSGAYIEFKPGSSDEESLLFEGLENVPAASSDAEGLRLRLTSDRIGKVHPGDPVLFRGRRAGQIEASRFDPVGMKFEYDLFVEPPFDKILNTATRFWKSSAVEFKAGADGFSLNADSLESILAGGVAFDLPEGSKPGRPVEDGFAFKLFETYSAVNQYPYRHYLEYLCLFDNSVRGLREGSSVEYRGLKIGHVEEVSFRFLDSVMMLSREEVPVPVLIRIYPGYLEMEDTANELQKLREAISEHAESRGLRAVLQHGNLLTGRLIVSLDFFENSEGAEMAELAGYAVLPSQPVGIERMERRLEDILDTIANLPLAETTTEIRHAIESLRAATDTAKPLMQDIDRFFNDEAMRALPARLGHTLAEVASVMEGLNPDSSLYQDFRAASDNLNGMIMELQGLIRKIEQQPNSLIFPTRPEPDPEPNAFEP